MCLLSLREAWDQRLAQTYTLPNIALYCMNYILGVHPTHDPMCIIASLRLMLGPEGVLSSDKWPLSVCFPTKMRADSLFFSGQSRLYPLTKGLLGFDVLF